jgi:hypothetical protein
MNKSNDNNSDLTLQICSNDSETYEENSFDEGLNETQLTKTNKLTGPPTDWFYSRGELIVNGGMEEFECGVPEGWNATESCSISRVTAPGHVHSGDTCVGLSDYVKLKQEICTGIHASRFFQLSFFSQLQGTNAGLTCKVTFLKKRHKIAGGSICIRGQDIPNTPRQFGYYTLITSQAPRGVTGAIVEFSVNTSGSQCVCIDDVSFTEQ